MRFHFAEVQKRHKFIQHQARAQQIADGGAVLPAHAQEPRRPARTRCRESAAATPAASPRAQCSQPKLPLTIAIKRQKRDQHAADVQRQVQAVARAVRRRVDDVHAGLLDLDIAPSRA